MQEVINYLRARGYRTYIVTGSGQDFVRVFAERVYGIPPEQVIGSADATKYSYGADGKPVLTLEPKLLLNDSSPTARRTIKRSLRLPLGSSARGCRMASARQQFRCSSLSRRDRRAQTCSYRLSCPARISTSNWWGLESPRHLKRPRKTTWILTQSDAYQLRAWLRLLPFATSVSEIPAIVSAMPDAQRDPHLLEEMLGCLGNAPSDDAEAVLFKLAEDDPRF